MSVVLRVELPTYSHSFHVSVSGAATVFDVKQEIRKSCLGGPRVNGQRIIWRGRFLDNTEKIQDIWKSPTDIPIIHLSVHPSSWTSMPPNLPIETSTPSASSTPTPAPPSSPAFGTPEASSFSFSPPQPTSIYPYHMPPPRLPPVDFQAYPYPAPPQRPPGDPQGFSFATPPAQFYTPPYHYMLPSMRVPAPSPLLPAQPSNNLGVNIVYVGFRHQMALTALTEGRVMDAPPPGMEAFRNHAVNVLAGMGCRWPTIFDEDFPPAQDEASGIKYKRITIDGTDYLSLVSPSGPPTPLQAHALKVLTHTFPLLLIPAHRIPHVMPVPLPPQPTTPLPLVNVNARLQQFGLPPLRARPNPMFAEFRALQIRALAAPLLLLTLRALFLLYFFSPFQKPLFGLIVSAWLLYETWIAIRTAMVRVGPRNPVENAAARPGANGNAPAARPGQPGFAQPHAPPPQRGPAPHNTVRQRHQADAVLDHLANINLVQETGALDARNGPLPPTTLHRLKTFVQLLVLTVHPAVWDRRRAALRRREGRVRTEANALQPSDGEPAEGEAAATLARARADIAAIYEARPDWIKEYMERVRNGEWVDE